VQVDTSVGIRRDRSRQCFSVNLKLGSVQTLEEF
jgi:hypothetical protein